MPVDFFLVALGLGLGEAVALAEGDGDALGDADGVAVEDAAAVGDADDGAGLGLAGALEGATVVGPVAFGAAVQAASNAAPATSAAMRVSGPMWSGYVGAGVE